MVWITAFARDADTDFFSVSPPICRRFLLKNRLTRGKPRDVYVLFSFRWLRQKRYSLSLHVDTDTLYRLWPLITNCLATFRLESIRSRLSNQSNLHRVYGPAIWNVFPKASFFAGRSTSWRKKAVTRETRLYYTIGFYCTLLRKPSAATRADLRLEPSCLVNLLSNWLSSSHRAFAASRRIGRETIFKSQNNNIPSIPSRSVLLV